MRIAFGIATAVGVAALVWFLMTPSVLPLAPAPTAQAPSASNPAFSHWQSMGLMSRTLGGEYGGSNMVWFESRAPLYSGLPDARMRQILIEELSSRCRTQWVEQSNRWLAGRMKARADRVIMAVRWVLYDDKPKERSVVVHKVHFRIDGDTCADVIYERKGLNVEPDSRTTTFVE